MTARFCKLLSNHEVLHGRFRELKLVGSMLVVDTNPLETAGQEGGGGGREGGGERGREKERRRVI